MEFTRSQSAKSTDCRFAIRTFCPADTGGEEAYPEACQLEIEYDGSLSIAGH